MGLAHGGGMALFGLSVLGEIGLKSIGVLLLRGRDADEAVTASVMKFQVKFISSWVRNPTQEYWVSQMDERVSWTAD